MQLAELRSEVTIALSSLITDVFEREPVNLTVNTRFNEDLDMDSLDILALVAEMERELGIQIDVAEIADVATVGQTVDLALRALNAVDSELASRHQSEAQQEATEKTLDGG